MGTSPLRETSMIRSPLDLYELEPNTGCWLWVGSMFQTGGYGRYGNKSRLAHRVVYELLVGPIPDGLTLDHLCRVRSCVNPKHLEPVTLKVNTLRGQSITALNSVKAHCKFGHPFNEFNTMSVPGGRGCRACSRERARKYKGITPDRYKV